MASFSLRSQRSGQYKEFTLLEILRLLGDRVNDEIWLQNDEDVYNLSSFQEIGGGGGGSNYGGGQWVQETPTDINGLDTFLLDRPPVGTMVLVLLNGMLQTEHRNYSRQGRTVSFPFRLNEQDSLMFIYPC